MLLVAGKLRRAGHAEAGAANTSAGIPRPTRELPALHTVEPVQDGERQMMLRREGEVQVAVAAFHVPTGSHEDFAALTCSSGCWPTLPPAVCTRRWWSEEGGSGLSRADSVAGSRHGRFRREVRDGAPLDTARDRHAARDRRGPAAKPVTSEEVERARNQILKQVELSLNNSERSASRSASGRHGRLAAAVRHRDRLKKVSWRMCSACGRHTSSPANRTVGLFYPTEESRSCRSAAAARRAGPGQGLQGRYGTRRRARSSTPHPRTSRRAPYGASCPAACRCRCCPRRLVAARYSSAWHCASVT